MSPDIQLGDIAASGASEAAGGAAEAAVEEAAEQSTGEWLKDMTELLDSKGLLEPLLFGPDSNIQQVESTPTDAGGDVEAADGDLDAEAVAEIGKTVIDTFGDVKISTLVKAAEQNPQQVNQLIEQKLGGEDGGD